MQRAEDVRDRRFLDETDAPSLNFIRAESRFVFRSHFRQGLRSHVLEVLDRMDVKREQEGEVSGGLRRFPPARPVKMFRIFRRRFSGLEQALGEIGRLRVLESYLPGDLVARSEEVLVSYRVAGNYQMLLCGLQEYVSGKVLDPWNLDDTALSSPPMRDHAARFVAAAKRMILEGRHVPDLAGIGNLFVTADGRIKLVDINNIGRLPEGKEICLDDRGYPACDKSIEALERIERNATGAPAPLTDRPPYDRFLTPERMRRVNVLEERFFESVKRPK